MSDATVDTVDAVEDTDDTDVETDQRTDDDTLDAATREKLDKVRREAYNLRERTKAAEVRADELARALFQARVAATGKVANPAEVPYRPDIVDDLDAINEAIDAAIAERPYIRSRKVIGDAGQGQRSESAAPKDFSALFR